MSQRHDEEAVRKSEIVQDERSTSRDADQLSINKAALGDNLPQGYYYSLPFIGTLLGLSLGQVSAYIFLILPTNVLTYINADIGPSKNIVWVNIGRSLAESCIFLIVGRLSDLFGRRWFFIGGNCVAFIGIIVGATAQNVNALIVASVVYGLGECIQLSFSVAVGELVPNKYRPMVISVIFITSAPIATFGPKIARAFIQHPSLGWRWTYYLNIIVVGLTIILLFFFYHPPTFNMLHERKSKWSQIKELDYIGTFLWISGLTLFLIGVSWGGGLYPSASLSHS